MKKSCIALTAIAAVCLIQPALADAKDKGNSGSGGGSSGSSANSGSNANSNGGGNGSGSGGNGNGGGGSNSNGNSGASGSNGSNANSNGGGNGSGSGANGNGGGGSNSNGGGNSGSGGSSGGGMPIIDPGPAGNGTVSLLAPCILTVGTSCAFEGNINLTNKLAEMENAYNGQTPAPPVLLDLQDLEAAEQTTGFADPHSGTITSSFLVSYYAVKGGNSFRLYQIAPTYTFTWSTAGLVNGGGNEPSVSHVIWIDPPPGSPPSNTTMVPEPETWALMILGFGLVGAALRRRSARRLAI